MKIFVLLFCCALAFVVEAQKNVNPVVETRNGAVKGSILKTRLGKDIYSFRGVRYADAPTGRNRFKQSTPAKPHTGIFDATQEGPSCPQFVDDSRVMAEDCLRLNVYTNKLPKPNGELQDVIVFLHPGAFYSFSGTYDFGPENILDSNIVLVTLNYRLGSLGWMSTGDERAPGNGGLKDQVLALRWIKDNIENFGGNPGSVTLIGCSAGSWSIALHMLSPMSAGLFHRAIMISGAPTAQKLLPNDQKNLAIKQAELLNCPTGNEDQMFDCLYEKPIEEFVKSRPGFAEFYGDPVLVWSPVIEQSHCQNNNGEAFLTGQPIDLIRERKGYFVPTIIGVNRDEFAYVITIASQQSAMGNNSIYDDFNSRWEDIAPISFAYERNTARSREISRELKSFYLNNQPLGPNHSEGLGQLYADSLIIFQTHRQERLLTAYSPAPVYNYLYDFEGCATFGAWSNGTHYGVAHHDELLIIFRVTGFPALCNNDVKTLNRLSGIITNFAKSGVPIPPNNPEFSNVHWQPNTVENPKYLKIADELSIEDGIIYSARMDKWEELFPLPPIAKSKKGK
uniref:Carboxylic ester hydrolase n=1 Tax=Meteorus pulchricornis TaxID=51522 RepID=A0A9E8DFI7_9HYME|nr:carboxylesterase 26 [Meteorus pulchricornis]